MWKRGDPFDDLYEVKMYYYLGMYKESIMEAQKFKNPSQELVNQCNSYMYRSYIAQKNHRIVIDEINSNSPEELQPIKKLAEYFFYPNQRKAIVAELDKTTIPSNLNFTIVAATIYCHEKNYESALRILQHSDNLECWALKVQILLKMNRIDLAQKELENDDINYGRGPFYRLAQQWVRLCRPLGPLLTYDKESILSIAEFSYKNSLTLWNLITICSTTNGIKPEHYENFELVSTYDSTNAEILINLMVISHLIGKPSAVANRYFTELIETHPDHEYVIDYFEKEAEFDKLCEIYTLKQFSN